MILGTCALHTRYAYLAVGIICALKNLDIRLVIIILYNETYWLKDILIQSIYVHTYYTH